MKRKLCFALISSLIMMSSAVFPQQKDRGEDLYQEGLMQMEGRGDYKKALEIFGQITKDFSGNRRVAAKAQFQTGVCYEKLGRSEAQKAYEQTIAEYPDQADLVAQARARLSALSAAAETGRGPLAHRVLSGTDLDQSNFNDMYPSPDGRRVAYVSMFDGRLNVRDLASGTEVQVAAGMPAAFHYSPRWSPDGKRLAVTEHDLKKKSTSIKLIDLATQRAVTLAGSDFPGWKEPSEWSRDGRFLLCVGEHSHAPGLVLITIDGGRMTVLADSVFPGPASISPDGRFVAYAIGEKKNAQIFVRSVTGGVPNQITNPPGGYSHPLWSPDGHAIAYERDGGISVVSMLDGKAQGTPRHPLSVPGVALRAWTVAGLYYVSRSEVETKMIPYQVPMNPATGKPGIGSIEDLPGRPSGSAWFAWSPDMQRIAFTHWKTPEVVVYSTERKTLESFNIPQQGSPRAPSWSADGNEVLVAYKPPQQEGEPGNTPVAALNPATGRIRELLPKIPSVWGISFSADGRRMAFYRQTKVSAQWYRSTIVVAATGQLEGQVVAKSRAVDDPRTDGSDEPGFSGYVMPRLSPRGDQLLFVRQGYPDTPGPFAPDAGTLWVVASNGTDLRRLAKAPLLMSAVWDPNGRFIAYTSKTAISNSSPCVLHVVDVATGAEHQIPLPAFISRDVRVTDWSSDGKLLGVVAGSVRGPAEYWVVQGLQEDGK